MRGAGTGRVRRPGGQTGTCGRAYDLDAMAAHCKDYQQLSLYWLERHPARGLDFSHESLLRETELQVRRPLDFCRLGFDWACLSPHRTQREAHSRASAARVRRPLRQTHCGAVITPRRWRRCAASSSPEEDQSPEGEAVDLQALLRDVQHQHMLAISHAVVQGIEPTALHCDCRLRLAVDRHLKGNRLRGAGHHVDLRRLETQLDVTL